MTTPSQGPTIVAPTAPTAPTARQPEPPGAGARSSALLLHALPPVDREWVLAQLAESERAALRALLADLRSLGMPADRGLVEEATKPVKPREPVVSGSREAAVVEELSRADPASLAEVLRDEPDMLLARLLSASDWPWRAELLTRLGEPKRRDIEALMPVPGSGGLEAPALRKQLLESVRGRLGGGLALQAMEARPWARSLIWLRQKWGRP